jgi:two-component system nitrate/nitrite response regulator NarL
MTIEANPLLLWRVLTNVVDNAARAAAPRGRVEISLRDHEGPAIDVADDGPGFGQGTPGTGSLGLSVVTSLLDACGGSLAVRARQSGGTLVHIRLPAVGLGGGEEVRRDSAMTSLVLSDDHGVFLDAMAAVLSQHGYTVTVSDTSTGTLEAVEQRKPDVCLLDRYFAEADSMEVVGELLDASPDTKVLVLSADPGIDGVLSALQAGDVGYLHKTRGIAALTAAIDRVRHGEVVVDVPRTVRRQREQGQDDPNRLAAYLTTRERDCLGFLVEGLNTSAIAARLHISPAIVRTHIQAVLTKLGVHSRLEAASLAVRYQLLGPD